MLSAVGPHATAWQCASEGSEHMLADGKEYYLSDDGGTTLVRDNTSMIVVGTLNRDANTLQEVK